MNRQVAVLAAVLLSGFVTSAGAATSNARGHAVQVNDDAPLATNAALGADCSIEGSVRGKPYCFGSEAAKAEFMKSPEASLAKAQANYQSMKKPG